MLIFVLVEEWMLNLKTATVMAYLNHVYSIEETIKKFDAFTEQLQEDLLNDEELDSKVEEATD